jgi:nucleobase:cation symporter-1, NCS1 family
VTVTIAGVIGLVIAVVFGGDQFQANFLLFLHVVSYYITPWVAVLLVDYFVVQRARRNSMPVRELLHPNRGIRATEPRGSRGDDHGRHNLGALHGQRLLQRPDRGSSLGGADVSYFVPGIVAAPIYLAARHRFAPRSANSSGQLSADCTKLQVGLIAQPDAHPRGRG